MNETVHTGYSRDRLFIRLYTRACTIGLMVATALLSDIALI